MWRRTSLTPTSSPSSVAPYNFLVIFITYFLFALLIKLSCRLHSHPELALFYSYVFCSCPGTVEGVLEPGMSSTTVRSMTILQHIPFVVRFKDRVKVRTLFVVPKVHKAITFSTQHSVPRCCLRYIRTLPPCFGSLFLIRPSPSSLPSHPSTFLPLGERGYSQKKMVGVCDPLPKTLSLMKSKICVFPIMFLT